MGLENKAYLADFTIVRASWDQVKLHASAAFVPWHKNKSWEDFWSLAELEHQSPWSNDGKMSVWVLVRRDDLGGEIYAGCETYRRKALYKLKGSDQVHEAWAYGIASVVTPVQHHRKGYATHLLRLLHYQLADPSRLPLFPKAWGAPPPPLSEKDRQLVPFSIASVLYSDVGSHFYEKCTIGEDLPGWLVDDDNNTQLVWKIAPSGSAAELSEDQQFEWEPVAINDLQKVGDELAGHVRADCASRESDKTVWTVDPGTPGTILFAPLRGAAYSENRPPEDQPGAYRTINKDGTNTIVVFTACNGSIGPRLLITYAHNLRPVHLPSLLPKLDVVGEDGDRTEGWAWGFSLDDPLVKAFKELPGREAFASTRPEVRGHLLGLAWYGSEDRGVLMDKQIWAWC